VPLTTPNLLSVFRIATAPVLIWLLMYPGRVAGMAAAAVFFLATISDYLDGYIARSYGSGTTVGKFLDPLADKVVVTTALIMLAAMHRVPSVPAWIVVVLVAREFLVTGIRAVAATEGKVFGAEELGKYKMVLQSIAIPMLMLHYSYFNVDLFAAGMFVLWISMVVSVWSGVDYYVTIIRAMKPKAARPGGRRAAI